jgi:hypothetical protein
MAIMIKHIMSIEDDMTAIPHLAHRVVGLKALWGQREMVWDYFKHGVVDTGLGEEDASPRATAEPAVQFLHRSASDFHEDIEVGLCEVN